MKPPCMIIVQYILPSLRVGIAKQLVETHDITKTEAAKKMNVTPAAVTQYLKSTRGETAFPLIESSNTVKNIISEIANDLIEGDTSPDILLLKMCKACAAIRTERLICELHKEEMPSLKGVEACACSLGLIGWDLE